MARKTVYRSATCKVEFEMDRKGIAELAMGPELMLVVMHLAETKAMPYAVRISPRSDAKHLHYQDAFVVVPGSLVIRRLKRVAAQLTNISPQATRVEWGTESTGVRGHRILGRTLDHLNSVRPGN